jgi:hypothetical protein
MVVFVVVINALVVMPLVVGALGLGAIGKLLGTVIPGAIAFIIVYLAIALIYRFGPSGSRSAGAGSRQERWQQRSVACRLDRFFVLPDQFQQLRRDLRNTRHGDRIADLALYLRFHRDRGGGFECRTGEAGDRHRVAAPFRLSEIWRKLGTSFTKSR